MSSCRTGVIFTHFPRETDADSTIGRLRRWEGQASVVGYILINTLHGLVFREPSWSRADKQVGDVEVYQMSRLDTFPHQRDANLVSIEDQHPHR